MGYDESFYPISPSEMDEWYFTPLKWIRDGQEENEIHHDYDFYRPVTRVEMK